MASSMLCDRVLKYGTYSSRMIVLRHFIQRSLSGIHHQLQYWHRTATHFHYVNGLWAIFAIFCLLVAVDALLFHALRRHRLKILSLFTWTLACSTLMSVSGRTAYCVGTLVSSFWLATLVFRIIEQVTAITTVSLQLVSPTLTTKDQRATEILVIGVHCLITGGLTFCGLLRLLLGV
ncbi:hypothetical protein J8273_8885 [Carpediemonas membranifera]|uniref:Uncharacterized protein n=1 Tax=Carpediemonas membranifera TaxID=201153 RepID=A0A8J6B422_9EUKA|nr:hypothetical protein J8273_8885 [Carpediemonas membranifera]|eukprot:KAG9389592.1 hypothetical protein J8273_8885 [Carpediemonas membranifera]